ncbi:WD repeat and FYVE domain-containing protein 3 [Thelohanellus kitauei]|uniref:WD repeat and FYVE domain-containing protein 3 n=1 Tax=Thelohanellus kitauei TaxID=669202 RepID=A0A0C2JW67_THEKT|nr:WD repeat and FYVE domain-containing protein 3 [Thelohanellus kitauei]
MDESTSKGRCNIMPDRPIIDELVGISDKISSLRYEVSDILLYCHKLVNLSTFEAYIKSAPSVNLIMFKASTEFSKYIDKISNDTKNVNSLLSELADEKNDLNWMNFVRLTIMFNSYGFMDTIGRISSNYALFESLMYVFSSLKQFDSHKAIDTVKIVEMMDDFCRAISIILRTPKVPVSKLISEKRLVNVLHEIINAGNYKWKTFLVQIIEEIFQNYEDSDIYKIIYNSRLVGTYFQILSVLRNDELTHIITIFQIVSIIFKTCEKDIENSYVVKIFEEFEQKNGLQICLDCLLQNDKSSESYSILFKYAIDIIVIASYVGDAESSGFMVMFKKKAHPHLIRNINAVNNMITFFVKNTVCEYNCEIVNILMNYTRLNDKNILPLLSKGIISVLVLNSIEKSHKTQISVCELIFSIFKSHMKEFDHQGMSAFTQVITHGDAFYRQQILGVFSIYVDSTHFIKLLVESQCFSSILQILQEFYTGERTAEIRIVYQILVNVTKIYGPQETMRMVHNFLMKGWDYSIIHDVLIDSTVDMIVLFLNYGYLDVLSYLLSKFESPLNIISSHRLSLIRSINLCFYKNKDAIGVFERNGGIDFVASQMRQLSEFDLDPQIQGSPDFHMIRDYLRNVFGVMLSLLNSSYRQNASYLERFDKSKFLELQESLFHLPSFRLLCHSGSLNSAHSQFLSYLFRCLFLVSFDDESVYNEEHSSTSPDDGLEITIGCIKHPFLILLIVKMVHLIFKHEVVRENNGLMGLTRTVLTSIEKTLRIRSNGQKMNAPWLLDLTIPLLIELIGQYELCDEALTKILFHILSHHGLDHVLRYLYHLYISDIPFFYLNLFLKYISKQNDAWRLYHKIGQIDVFQYYHIPRAFSISQMFSEDVRNMTESSLSLSNLSIDELGQINLQTKEGCDTFEESSRVTSIIICDKGSQSEAPYLEHAHDVETMTEDSQQWKTIKNLLLSSMNAMSLKEPLSSSLESVNRIGEWEDQQLGTSSWLNTNFHKFLSLIHGLQNFLKDLKSNTQQPVDESYFNLLNNQRCYFSITQSVKNAMFHKIKNKKNEYTFPLEFSHLLWFKIDPLSTEATGLTFLSLMYQDFESQNGALQDVNVLTIIYYPLWNSLSLSTEPKAMNELNLLEYTLENKYKSTIPFHIKSREWHHFSVTVDGSQSNKGFSFLSIYLNGTHVATLKKSLETLVNTKRYLRAEIGSTRPLSANHSSFQIGPLLMANKIFKESEIRQIYQSEITELDPFSVSFKKQDELNRILYPTESYRTNEKVLFVLEPSRNISFRNINFSDPVKFGIDPEYDFIPFKNSIFSKCDQYFRERKLSKFCTLRCSDHSLSSVQTFSNLPKCLFLRGGIGKFIILIEQSDDSNMLFNNLDLLFNFILGNYHFISPYLSDKSIGALTMAIKMKRHLIDLRVALLIISFASNRLYVPESILYPFIEYLLIDLEMWFNCDGEITQEILRFILKVLLDPLLSPITLCVEFIENVLIEALLISFIHCSIDQNCQKIFYEIINYIFQKFVNVAILQKLLIFIFEFSTSIVNRQPEQLPEIEGKNIETTSHDHVSISILELVYFSCLDEEVTFIELLNSSVGVAPFILLINLAKHVNVCCLAFQITFRLLKYSYANGLDFNKQDSSLVKNLKEKAVICCKNQELAVPQLSDLYFYIGRILSKSIIPFDVCISHLIPDFRMSDYTDKQIQAISSGQQYALIGHSREKRDYLSTDNYTESLLTTINYLCEKIKGLTLKNLERLEFNNFLMPLVHFLQIIHYSIVSRSEVARVCCSDKFLYPIVCIIDQLQHTEVSSEHTESTSLIRELLLKVCVFIYDYAFDVRGSWNTSSFREEPWSYQDYPQTNIYFMIYKHSHEEALSTISLIFTRFLGSFSNQQNILSRIFNSGVSRISMISSIIYGQTLCFGSTFDMDIFQIVIRLSRCVFSINQQESLAQILKFSSIVNKYISNILLFDPNDIDGYSNKFQNMIPLLSANAHILFDKNYCDCDTIDDVISLLFIHVMFVSSYIETDSGIEVREESNQERLLLFKETFLRIISIYDLFLSFHFEKFKECMSRICCIMLPDDPTLINEFESLLRSPSKLFAVIRKSSYNKANYQIFQSFTISKCDLNMFRTEEQKKTASTAWSDDKLQVHMWFSNLSQFIKSEYLIFVSKYQNYQMISTQRLQSDLSEIQESLYHDGNRSGRSENAEQRYEALRSSGYFGIFNRLKKNDHFYYNHAARNRNISRRELLSISDYTEEYQSNVMKYSSFFRNVVISDFRRFLSSLYRSNAINSLYMLQYFLKKKPFNDMKSREIFDAFTIARVHWLEAIEGVLLLLTDGILIVDGLCINSQRVIVESLQNKDNPFFTNIIVQKLAYTDKSFCKFLPYEEIVCVRKRRYSLVSTAIEIFDNENFSVFIVFKKPERKAFIHNLTQYLKKFTPFNQSKRANASLFTHFEPYISTLLDIRTKNIQEKWADGKIDNFTYLLFLNIRAGRSFNDLSQYPVFPWILADYQSEYLDLEDPKTFRDLTKPMGAQNPQRLEGFLRRYNEWDNFTEQVPKFMYATFYSTSMNTCSYMARVEPYSSLLIHLQGGGFDLPDRMFHSIQDSYDSSARVGSADVKELIPEFFHFPEFLKNSNKFLFGAKQSGKVVNDVLLPPWARGDPREFIRLNRMALESEYVSQNIHHWIDLIFGYKQVGQSAVEANNVFHSWFYKGSVNLDNVRDTMVKNSIMSFINNFGQAPQRLFGFPHPKRKTVHQKNHINNIFLSEEPKISKISEHPPLIITDVIYVDQKLYVAFERQAMVPPSFKTKLCWDFFDNNLYYFTKSKSALPVSKMLDTSYHGEISCCMFLNVKYLALGCVSGNISIWRYDICQGFKITFVKILCGHQSPITCITSSSSEKFMLTGAEDGFAYQWDLIDFTFLRQIFLAPGPIISLSIVTSTSDMVIFQENSIHIVDVQGELISTATVTDKIICGISINNQLQDDFQHLAVSTGAEIEIWQYGYDPRDYKKQILTTQREDGWLEFQKTGASPSPRQDKPSLLYYRTIDLKKFLQNEEYITALRIDHEYLSLYAGTSQGNILIIKSCNLNL